MSEILATRVLTRRGEDMLKLVDGRWAKILSEDTDAVMIETTSFEYVGDDAFYANHDIRYLPSKKKTVLRYEHAFIEDKRAEISARRSRGRY